MDYSKERKDSLTRIFNFIVYILDYIYKEISAIPKDFLTEIHLRFFRYNKNPNKKILGVWDFNQRLSRLGDFLGFLETLSILRLEFNLKENKKNIDICFIDDDNYHNSKQLRYSKSYFFKKNIKLSTIVNPHIDSIFAFKSNAEFERFYQQNRKRYLRWPPTISGSLPLDCQQIERFYKKNKCIPLLVLPVEILSKVYKFYESHVYPSLPIILNIRNNPDRSRFKNSDLPEFEKFLKYYEKNKLYKFIIICNKVEIPANFRDLSNIIFSKDYFDGVEYDFALIKTSYLSIFPSSGMAILAWHSDVPFAEFGPHAYGGKETCPPKGKTYAYLKKHQRFYHNNKITFSFLISEFENLVRYLKENNINNNLRNKVEDKKEYEAQF